MRVCSIAVALAFSVALPGAGRSQDAIETYVFEGYPETVQARLEQNHRQLLSIAVPPSAGMAPSAVISELEKWQPGQTVRVAFKGGDKTLHKKIADTAATWTQYANLKLDFGVDESGNYRTWSNGDEGEYKAEIRVSFDQKGYWSLVGNTATNRNVAGPGDASLNLERFDAVLPADWQAVVLHEFGHAIGAEHEHQHPTQGCDNEWRWFDDTGYQVTKDAQGRFLSDGQGRRPGLYTVLSGYPNFWPKSKVDFNLRQLTNSSAYSFGDFDVKSIMKYHFAAWMFKNGTNSQCYTGSENTELSSMDKQRITLVYPKDAGPVAAIKQRRQTLVSSLLSNAQQLPTTRFHLQSLMLRLQ